MCNIDTRPALSMLATLSAKDRSTSSSSSIQLREVSTVGGTAHSTAATRSMVNGQSMMDVTTPIMSIFNYPHKMDDFDGAKVHKVSNRLESPSVLFIIRNPLSWTAQ